MKHMVESIKEVNTVVQVRSKKLYCTPQLKAYFITADTNNNCENTAEPLQVGQREVDGEVLLR